LFVAFVSFVVAPTESSGQRPEWRTPKATGQASVTFQFQTELFTRDGEPTCFPWSRNVPLGGQAGRRDRWTTKYTKSTKVSDREAFDTIFYLRPEMPVTRDRAIDHAIRQLVDLPLRDLRVLRGCTY
ncbi:MAG: hypothetical protein RLY70_4171, partial [Planctomycetota bacterium]